MLNLEKKIDDIFALWQQDNCPGGQVLVRLNEKTIYQKNFGYANLEHSIKVSDGTVFHVASVSKQITVLCALLLCEEGLLDIDGDVRDYVPELILFEEPVSIRNLMNNVSGIRDQWELLMLRGVRIDDTITQEDLKTAIGMQTTLNFEPGSKYMYSNSNFTILAEIVFRLSGKTLAQFAQERIFAPLGMKRTQIFDDCTQIVPNRAACYDDNGEGKFCTHMLNYSVCGATSLNTTAMDMMLVLENYAKPTICKKETIDTMMERPTLADGTKSPYGAGLMLGCYKNHEYFEHGGVDAAFRAHAMSFYNDGLNIIILSNTQNTNPSLAARKIAEIVLEIEGTQPQPNCFSKAKVAPVAGNYYATAPDICSYSICENDGKFYFGSGKNAPELRHLEGNCYRVGYTNQMFYFGDAPCFKAASEIPLIFAKEQPENIEVLLQFEGTYESDEIDSRYYITEQDGFLVAAHTRHGKNRLIKAGRDKYLMNLGEVVSVLNFSRGSGNRIIGMSLDCGRVKHLGFTHLEG